MGKRLGLVEFILLIALMFAMIAFGTDAMLPALSEIAIDLGTMNVNHAQLIITSFILGTGLGQLIMGPLSDTYGRKPILLAGLAVFFIASFAAYRATSLEWMLLARFVQGLGVSAPRAVSNAMVRDLYQGRMMARVISLAMMIFVIAPALAPFIGQTIMQTFGWRSIYISFTFLALWAALWLLFRQQETLALENRRPFRPSTFWDGIKQVASNRRVLTSIAVLSLTYSIIFSYISSAQQTWVDWLGTGDKFPLYFATIALISGAAGGLNAILVVRFGMWLLSTIGVAVISLFSLISAFLIYTQIITGPDLLPLYVVWSVLVFFVAGLVFSNVNALAMEPMGHIAGMASAIIGSISTLLSVLIAVPIGQMYNGSGLPLILGIGIVSGLAFLINLTNPREV